MKQQQQQQANIPLFTSIILRSMELGSAVKYSVKCEKDVRINFHAASRLQIQFNSKRFLSKWLSKDGQMAICHQTSTYSAYVHASMHAHSHTKVIAHEEIQRRFDFGLCEKGWKWKSMFVLHTACCPRLRIHSRSTNTLLMPSCLRRLCNLFLGWHFWDITVLHFRYALYEWANYPVSVDNTTHTHTQSTN